MLNAFRHLRSIHGFFALSSHQNLVVLNAFRHLRSIHVPCLYLLTVAPLCSTPFGISDPFTSSVVALERLLPGAQRLSASQIHSLISSVILIPFAPVCSTPFGISDPFTDNHLHLVSRFQQCSTPFGISDPFTRSSARLRIGLKCAQRLSASQIHSRPWRHTTTTFSRRAQRLSASQIHSQEEIRWTQHGKLQCSTPFGISDPFTIGWRKIGRRSMGAQRLSASQIHSRRWDMGRKSF